MARKPFDLQIAAAIGRFQLRKEAVMRETVQRVIEVAQEPGPSVASTRKAVSKGAGLGKVGKNGGRGVSKRAFGPVAHTGGTGNLPVDTGFMRSSLVATVGTPAEADRERPAGEATYQWDGTEVASTIAAWDTRSHLFAIYTANYARFAEHRYAFVRLAAQQFPRIHQEVSAEAKRAPL